MYSKTIMNANNRDIGITASCLSLYFAMMPFDILPLLGLKYLLQGLALFTIFSVINHCAHTGLTIKKTGLYVVVFLLYSCLTVCYSINLNKSTSAIVTLTLNLLLVLVAGGCYKYNDKEISRIKKGIIIGTFITFIVLYFNVDFSSAGRLNVKLGYFESDSNLIPGYFFFLLVYSIQQLINHKKVLYSIPIIGVLVISLMTGSRGAMIGILLLIGFSVLYLVKQKLSIRKVITMTLLILVFVWIFNAFIIDLIPREITNRYTIDYIRDSGSTGRNDIWENLLGVFGQSSILRELFGHGIGTTTDLTTATVGSVSGGYAAHNLWIDQLMTGGIVGIIILVIMQIRFIKRALKSREITVIAPYLGCLFLCMSLSLISYKPMWNCMILIMIYENRLYANNCAMSQEVYK
ncbi:MAG: O-antigen ligase family protein [Pelotomaculum sp.]|jgi:O-antigen ligase